MNATSGIILRIDTELESQKILDAISQAMEYLADQIARSPAPRAEYQLVEWRDSRLRMYDVVGNARECLEVSMTEQDDDGRRESSIPIPVHYLFDPVSRDISMLRLWGKVLSVRSSQIMKRIDEQIRLLELEETNGKPVAH